MTHKIIIVFFSISLLFTSTTKLTPAQISVGPNIHVSRTNGDVSHTEVLIASELIDPTRMLGCSIIGPTPDGKIITGVYASFDAGVTWRLVVTDGGQMQSFDPSCVYGINNTAHFASLSRGKDFITRLNVYNSQDGGKTWQESKIPAGSRYHIDREYLAVDTTNGKYHGRVYLYAYLMRGYGLDNSSSVGGITLYRSLDGGKTYEVPVQRLLPDRTTSIHGGNAIVLSDGTFVALFSQLALDSRNDGYPGGEPKAPSSSNGFLKVITSSDGGETLGPAVQVSDLYADWRVETSTTPSLAADLHSDLFRDRLYAVWADGRFGGRTQVVLSYSADKGQTWSKPRLVNDDRRPPGDVQRSIALPAVAVNKFGVVGVSWYDRRDSRNGVDYHVRFAASLDGGETFTPSVQVSEEPRVFDQNELWTIKGLTQSPRGGTKRLLVVRDEWLRGGDTAGLTADANGVFYPLWIDNRTGLGQVWTAPVTVQGKVTKHGEPNLAMLEDVTAQVEIEVVGSSFDRSQQEGTLSIRLRNISQDAVAGPIKLRALMVTSELGLVQLLKTENGLTGDGATWDFTSPLEKGVLAPGSVSGIKHLAFRLTDFESFKQRNGSYKWILVDLNAIILGSMKSVSKP